MTTWQERAVIFGRDATAYDSARPDYPPEAIDHVLRRASARNAVEIGAGTGKATASFASGLDSIVCIEPSPKMAAVLEARNLAGVEVVVSTFEDWSGPASLVDLVYAAQAWHWVDHAAAYQKVMGMLRPGGVIALFWNVPRDRYQDFDQIYARHAPEIVSEQEERIRRRDSYTWLSDLSEHGFDDVELSIHSWSETLSPEELRTLHSTYSDHMMIPEPRRTRLLDALAEKVRDQGGRYTIEYDTNVFTGVRPADG